MKITNEIAGADAERLADCIQFAAKHGLSVGKHTQAGLNESSGNVWLWDEDWPATIYEGLCMDEPCFSWACLECGEEQDADTLAEIEAMQEHFNEYERCKECME